MTVIMAMMMEEKKSENDDVEPLDVYIQLDARPNKAWSSELFLLFLHALC